MKIFIGSLLALIIVIFGIFFAAPSTSGQKEQTDEATVVQKGQVTEKEREYSKEYKKLYLDFKGKKLSEISKQSKLRGNNQEAGVSIGIPSVPTVGDTPVITSAEFLRDLSCKADAVVVGSVRSKTAHLTEDETFVYTEYEFSVKDILKNNPASPFEANANIQITRPGGLIKLDNQVIRVEDKSYEPLQIKKEYLLFLTYLSTANGYLVSDVKGDFILENNSFRKMSKFGLPKELESNPDSESLLNAVRNSTSAVCNQTPKETPDEESKY